MEEKKSYTDAEIDEIIRQVSQARKDTGKDFAEKELPPRGSSGAKHGWKTELLEWVKALAGAFLLVFVLFYFLISVVSVEGSSMVPTLQENDRLVVYKLFYKPRQGDIVITTADNPLGRPLVKRVIAVGNQEISITAEGEVLVDGEPLEEGYIAEEMGIAGDQVYPLTVPEGSVFLMGDNRNWSTDSRFTLLGCIPEEEIVGKVVFRFWPFERIGAPD